MSARHARTIDLRTKKRGNFMNDCNKAENARKARVGVDPVSYCGHHCAYCFLAEECGGCRSTYNACSFATLFEDGKCPNVTCCVAKGFDGCYECDDLVECCIGYYARENEYVAKATALFVRKYGKQRYTRTLLRVVESSVNYPKSFDEEGSVEKALQLLESFIR